MTLELNPVTVSDDDVAEYRDRGYWISPRLLSDEDIAALRREYDRIYAGDYDFDAWPFNGPQEWDTASLRVRTFANGWWVNATVREVAMSPVIGAIGARLMGTPEVRLWHDQVIYKPGVGPDAEQETGGNIGWHQDYGYWLCSSTTNMCTAWIALQDTDLTNGGMRTVVGSHKWGLVKDSGTFFEQDLELLHKKFSAQREWIDEPCIMKAGQASFHHSLCFHGSGPNLTNQPRLSLALHLMPEDCAYQKTDQFHQNIRGLGPYARHGASFVGDWFPRLWPR